MPTAKVRPAKLRAGMLRSAAGKVVWMGRATVFLVGLAVILALVLGAASVAMSATGQPFVLGKQNTADQASKLIRHGAGVALSLEVQNGQPPMKVDSDAKVANLNSDQLDGKSEADFYAAGSKVDDSSHADAADSATNAANAQNADNATTADNATNADLLDDKDSSDFYAAGSKVEDSSHADQADTATNAATATNADNATNADLLDDKDSSDFAAAYERTVVVSPVGTDTENGTALLDALSGIKDASATDPYLLSIEPGTYDLGNGSLQMKEYVDIQGSGELSTLITTDLTNEECTKDATLFGADNAELRFLAVVARATNSAECTIAIFNDSVSPRLTQVTASARAVNANPNNIGVYNLSSSPIMTNVTATASGGSTTAVNTYTGVLNQSSSPIMTNVTATGASGGTETRTLGVVNESSSPTIKQSTLSGNTYALSHGDGIAKVADTQLVGTVQNVGGTLHCFSNYDEDMAAVTCP